MTRIEKDSLGEMEIPDDVYYGIQTRRAMMNFPVSGIREPKELVRAYALLKKACALTNTELGMLDSKIGDAIVRAADEVLEGMFAEHFPVDVFQAGAGTSFHMNVNEVIANRALELLGKRKGDYDFLSPNDHVNMAQSTNDTFPTASHIAVAASGHPLLASITGLARVLVGKGEEFATITKSGRTHLTDATPVTLGQEFRAYGSAMLRAALRIEQRLDELLELPIGGTSTGTGLSTHPRYRKTVVAHIAELTAMPFVEAKDSFEALQSRAQLAAFSSALKELALELIRIANDLRLLGSGPTTGFAEIRLPALQPGSSMMPGKVNPVMAECLNMISFHVIGSDLTVSLAAQAGQIELNVMTPIMTYHILQSMDTLTNFLPVFAGRCVEGIEADEEKCRSFLEMNPSLATILSSKIGYLKAAELAKESVERKIPVQKLAVEKRMLTQEEADRLFDPANLSRSQYG